MLAHARLTMSEIAEAGGRRVSVGGALTWVALSAMAGAAREMLASGDFSSLATAVDVEELLGY